MRRRSAAAGRGPHPCCEQGQRTHGWCAPSPQHVTTISVGCSQSTRNHIQSTPNPHPPSPGCRIARRRPASSRPAPTCSGARRRRAARRRWRCSWRACASALTQACARTRTWMAAGSWGCGRTSRRRGCPSAEAVATAAAFEPGRQPRLKDGAARGPAFISRSGASLTATWKRPAPPLAC